MAAVKILEEHIEKVYDIHRTQSSGEHALVNKNNWPKYVVELNYWLPAVPGPGPGTEV